MGNFTCEGYPGSLRHIKQDAEVGKATPPAVVISNCRVWLLIVSPQTIASWGVDMLKLDGCHAELADYETGYPNMSKALNETGRPIVFSCSWPAYIVAHGLKVRSS